MSRSDRSRRDAERSARRAKRLAERQKMRAERKAKEAERAARRAERLSERAAGKRRRRTSESEIERSIEDFVDDVTEKWTRKAEDWFKSESGGSRDAGHDPEYDDDSTERDDVTRSRHRSRRRYRTRRRGSFRSRVNSGRGLYRDSQHKKICGVCAGVADYLDVDRWQVRLVAVLGLIFVPSVAITIYFIAYFLMDDKPYYRQVTDEYEEEPVDDLYEETDAVNSGRHASRSRRPTAGMSSAHAMRVAKQKFVDIEDRLRAMETHVTSSKFELQRELNQIADEEPGSSSASS